MPPLPSLPLLSPPLLSPSLPSPPFPFPPLQGPLVYVNYARRQDFELLKTIDISVNGCICIARYGNIYRGSKVRT